MKKIKYLLILIILMMPIRVLADSIYRVSMDVYIDKEGNADIVETWDVKADSGSEWYKQLYNMGHQELSNFKVSMDGKTLEYKEWNVNESLKQKAGYYGINYVSEGLELCFGKSDMKRHTFTLSYSLSDVIFNTSDSQVLYQTWIPKATLDDYEVVIHSYYDFPQDIELWGYGKYGAYYYPKDGKIEMTSDDGLYNEYVTLLAKFPLETFNTENRIDGYDTFESVYETAEMGASHYDYGDDYDYEDTSFSFFDFIWGGICFLFPFLCVVGAATATKNSGYGYKNNQQINKKEVPFFREIPCDKNIYYADALMKINEFGHKEGNILGSIILKWVREKKIGFRNETTGIFNKETSVIDLTYNPMFTDELEQKLFDMMYKASGDGLLEAKELEKWCRRHYSEFLNLFTRIDNREIDKLKANGHIYKRTSKEECKKKNVMDSMIYDDSVKLYGLKKYLQEFANMNTKEVMEVNLWDEYLMFAYIFGIADKVAKQLKNMYPEVEKMMREENMDMGTFIYINNLATSSVHAATSARSAAESYSSGGGGFSSGGGGGGSFGGGGSMGGR